MVWSQVLKKGSDSLILMGVILLLVDYLADISNWAIDSFGVLFQGYSGDILLNIVCYLLCFVIVAFPFIVFRVVIDCILGG